MKLTNAFLLLLYVFSDCKVKDTAKRAQDPEAEKRLWALSEKIVKL